MATINEIRKRIDESNVDDWVALIAGIGTFLFSVSPVLFVITFDSQYSERYSRRELIGVRILLGLSTLNWWAIAITVLTFQQGTIATLVGLGFGLLELNRDFEI